MNRPVRELDAASSEAPKPPQVFVRALSVPPGAPWEQARAARLDARHGAPLPIGELMHQVRRLEPWGPGKAGRYAALYVRAREYQAPFETDVEVGGRTLRAQFGARAVDRDRARMLALVAGLLVVSGAALGGGLMLALGARSEATARLEAAEQLAASRLKMAEGVRARQQQARELRDLVGQARPMGEVVGDLTWVATSKAPEARILAVRWEGGLLAAEARGETPPFQSVDRPVAKASRPLRPGVWLWGVGRPGARTGGAEPFVAEMAR